VDAHGKLLSGSISQLLAKLLEFLGLASKR
jgi:hypothetical protein